MGKSKGSTTTTTGPDAQTQDYAKQMWAAAQGAAQTGGVPVNQLTTDAANGFARFGAAGNLGLGALSGDPNSVQQLMNPFQGQVIDQMNQQYGRDQQQTTNNINAQATQAGAFGGSRHGVAQGVALGELGQAHQGQIANTLQSGYNNAMGQAGQLANLGFSANGAQASLGDYMHGIDVQNNPAMRQYQFLNGAMATMPRGTTSVETQQAGHNGVTGALGGAATGAEIGSYFPGFGTAIGAGLGGLMGMFG